MADASDNDAIAFAASISMGVGAQNVADTMEKCERCIECNARSGVPLTLEHRKHVQSHKHAIGVCVRRELRYPSDDDAIAIG